MPPATWFFKVPVQDTLVVKENTAVFIEPNSLKIEKRKKAIGEEDFYIGADYYMYYMHLAHEYLEKQKVKIVFVKSPTKVIQFIGKDQLKIIVKLDTLSALWNVYLSTPIKKRFKIDLTDVESKYKEYFRKL